MPIDAKDLLFPVQAGRIQSARFERPVLLCKIVELASHERFLVDRDDDWLAWGVEPFDRQ